MYEKKYCRDLQNAQLTFLEMVVIYQKTDELYTLDGYLSKWNIQCYPNLPVPLLGVTEAEAPSDVLGETQSVAARAVSSTTAVAGPPATARPMREFAEQPDEEMWTDDAGHAWWPGVHKYRQTLPMSAPLQTDDKRFICPTAYPSIQTEGAKCPLLRERLKLGAAAIEHLSRCSLLQQSWLLAHKARFGWHDGLLIKWIRLGNLTWQYPKAFPGRAEVEIYNNKTAVLNCMWPKSHAYQFNQTEVSIQGGFAVYPPDQPHLIDVVGSRPTEPEQLLGSWPRTYTPDIHEVALRYDGIMDEVTQHLHENN